MHASPITTFGPIMTLVVALLLLNFLIFIHELAHLLAAHWLDTPVEEFSLGVGPELGSYRPPEGSRFHETRFVVRWLPIGGFVKMAGQLLREEDADKEEPSPKEEPDRKDLSPSPGRHLLIALSGPVGSVVAMFLLFLVGLGVWGNPPRPHLDGFTRHDAQRFEPSFAAAIQATANPTIFVYEPSSVGSITPNGRKAPAMGLSLSSPLAPWKDLSLTESTQRAMQATRQATTLLGEMMLWLAKNPRMFAKNVGSPFGMVDGAQRMAASSSSVPEPSPLDATTAPERLALADTSAPASGLGASSSSSTGSSPGEEKDKSSSEPSSSSSSSSEPSTTSSTDVPPPSSMEDRGRRVVAPADSDSVAQAAPSGETDQPTKKGWSVPSVDETRGYGLVFFYLGLLSVFIAYLNLAPIPPFDGFQVVVSTFELISQRRVPRKARLVAGIIGAVVVIYILTQGIVNDLQRRGTSLSARDTPSQVVLREASEGSSRELEGVSLSSSSSVRSARLRIQRFERSSKASFRPAVPAGRGTGVEPPFLSFI